MRKLLLSIIFLGISQSNFAQTSSSHSTPKIKKDTLEKYWAIKLAPFTLLEPNYSTLELDLAYRFNPKYELQGTVGYGNHNFNPWFLLTNVENNIRQFDYIAEAFRTWRFRVEGRYILSKYVRGIDYSNWLFNPFFYKTRRRYRPKNYKLYLALNLAYKDAKVSHSGLFGENCDENGNCDFFRFGIEPSYKKLLSYHFKVGLLKISNHFLFEQFIGLGLRHLWVESPTRNGQEDITIIDTFTKGFYSSFSITAGIKVGYIIPRK